MKESVVVSVSSIRGTRHYRLGKRIRRILKGSAYAVMLGVAGIAATAYYLKSEVDIFKVKQQELENQSSSLTEEVESLKSLKHNLESDLLEREARMHEVADRLGDLESVLGMEDAQGGLDKRLDTAAITTTVRVLMLNQIPSGPPVKNARISSGYGKRVHPVTKKATFHRGLDFAVNTGTALYAPADGVIEVTRASNKGSGNFLRIQHSFGFSSSYSHMKKFSVKSGQFVEKGELIGYSGNSGLSSGPHLHYEVRFVGRALNPRSFVDWDINNFESIFTKERGIRWDSLVKKVEQRVSTQLLLSSQKAVPSKDS